MHALTIGADVATMATGLAAVIAAVPWTVRQVASWRAEHRQRKRRDWHGNVGAGSVSTWDVRLADPTTSTDAAVTVEILKTPNGPPDPARADDFRKLIEHEHRLSRQPTTHELDLLRRRL